MSIRVGRFAVGGGVILDVELGDLFEVAVSSKERYIEVTQIRGESPRL